MLYLRINYVAIQLCKDTLPNPANIYLFKVSSRNTGKRPGICSKLTINIPVNNNSSKEHWKVCINTTTKFWGHKNKARNRHESINSNHLTF